MSLITKIPEGISCLKVSKNISIGVLLSQNTLKQLLNLQKGWNWVASDKLIEPQKLWDIQAFINDYGHYIETLKKGLVPNETFYRQLFSFSLSLNPEEHYVKRSISNRVLLKACKPVIQSQFFTLGFSKNDKKMRGNVMGKEAIFWGLQLSYPQLASLSEGQNIQKVAHTFCNTVPFQELRRFLRQRSTPVFFSYKQEKIVTPFRIDKEGMEGLEHHPHLKACGLELLPYGKPMG